jgi:branched-chain amino acid transport system ATP-binding protein
LASGRELAAPGKALTELVELDRFTHLHASELPTGAHKRLDVVRALMAQPRVFLLDEPTAGLNDTETAELANLVRAIRESGVTVLMSSTTCR